jgi:hypothetical protein
MVMREAAISRSPVHVDRVAAADEYAGISAKPDSQAPHATNDAFQGLNLLNPPRPLEAVNPTLKSTEQSMAGWQLI